MTLCELELLIAHKFDVNPGSGKHIYEQPMPKDVSADEYISEVKTRLDTVNERLQIFDDYSKGLLKLGVEIFDALSKEFGCEPASVLKRDINTSVPLSVMPLVEKLKNYPVD